MLLALSAGLGTLAVGLHSVAAFRRERIVRSVSIAAALSICVAIFVFWVQPPSGTPKPPSFFEGVLFCLNGVSIFGDEVNLMFRDRVPGAYGKIWRAILLVVTVSVIAAFLNPSFMSWIFPAVFFAKPLFRGIRRRSLGDVVFEFPRVHGELWKSTGSVIRIAALTLLAVSIAQRDVLQFFFNLAIAVAADSLRRNAGRAIVRAEGIESHSRLIGWADLRGYEWFEQNGVDWLRLKNETQDLWIATKPVAEVNAAFSRAGLPVIA